MFSVNALCWADDDNKNNANIAIRVLLASRARNLRLHSLSSQFSVRIDNSTTKLELGANLALQWRDDSSLILNGNRLQATVLCITSMMPDALFQVAGQVHRGELRVYLRSGGFRMVNHLPLETYLLGTLAGEMNPNWEIEILKAQAVASRSFAMNALLHPRDPLYDIESTTDDQVFAGANLSLSKITEAVQATRGIFLSENYRPLKAYFHSRCGGTTQSAHSVWATPPTKTLQPVECPYCKKHPVRWETVVDRLELVRVFASPIDPGHLSLSARRNATGRVIDLTMSGDGIVKSLPINTVRARLGYTRFKSALFDWKLTESGAIFDGRGYGHGVGMCQWGAREFARQGKDFRAILGHFYSGARLN